MKKTTKNLLALMAGTLAMAACSNDAIIENNATLQHEVARKHITFTAKQEDNGATRATISSANPKQIVWTAGDKFTVLYHDANTSFGFDNVDFSLTGGANTSSGTFTGSVLESVTDETVYTALYPCHTKDEKSLSLTESDLTEFELQVYNNAKLFEQFDTRSFEEILRMYIDVNIHPEMKDNFDRIMLVYNKETIYVNNSVTLTAEGKITGVSLPVVQTATEGSFDPATAIMMAQAVGETSAMEFKHVTSYFKFVAPFDCSSVQLIDNAYADKMAGTLTLDYNHGEPTATVTDNGASSIALTGTIEAGKTYYIATLPQTFSQGITLEFVKTDGTVYAKSTTSGYTLGRNKASNMSEPTLTSGDIINPPYVTFSAASSQTLTMSRAIKSLEYSVGGGAWKTLGTNTVTFGGSGNDLRLRGRNSYGTTIVAVGEANIKFGNNTKVACSGDIRTLVDYRHHETASTANARFTSLFEFCSQLTSAPALPATTLADGCYNAMFYYCTSLEVAPELPATELTQNCYNGMFSDCTSLTKAPVLPAKELAPYCYFCMFEGCSKLNYVKADFTTTLGTEYPYNTYTKGWLENVASTGTFVKNPAATWDVRGVNGVPNGWTIEQPSSINDLEEGEGI